MPTFWHLADAFITSGLYFFIGIQLKCLQCLHNAQSDRVQKSLQYHNLLEYQLIKNTFMLTSTMSLDIK